eukprot:15460247-Alexandrium_andersonii.AAC.1
MLIWASPANSSTKSRQRLTGSCTCMYSDTAMAQGTRTGWRSETERMASEPKGACSTNAKSTTRNSAINPQVG